MQTESVLSQNGESFKVSFIIPYYNEPTTILKECVESILKLRLSPEEREIIIVDDGSDISPLDDLMEFQDLLIYIRCKNKGTSAARNLGMKVASGKYIQFIDADDYLIPVAYDHCVQIAKRTDADMVRFEPTDNEASDYALDMNGPVSGSEYMKSFNLKASVCNYLVKRVLGCSLISTKEVYYTEAKTYYYRQRNGSLTHKTDKMSKIQRLNNSVEVIRRLCDLSTTLPNVESEALERRVAQLSMDYLYNVIRLTHSGKHLEQAINNLKEHGLFPLPEKNYTTKYVVFRKALKSKLGKAFLLAAIR